MLDQNQREHAYKGLPDFRVDGFGNEFTHRLCVKPRALECLAAALAVLVGFVLRKEAFEGFHHVLGCGH